jgi:hypothetical protein
MSKEATLKIGNSGMQMKEAVSAVADGIKRIFEAAYANRMEQSTVQVALAKLAELASVTNTSVTGCTFKGDKTINIDTDKEEGDE